MWTSLEILRVSHSMLFSIISNCHRATLHHRHVATILRRTLDVAEREGRSTRERYIVGRVPGEIYRLLYHLPQAVLVRSGPSNLCVSEITDIVELNETFRRRGVVVAIEPERAAAVDGYAEAVERVGLPATTLPVRRDSGGDRLSRARV